MKNTSIHFINILLLIIAFSIIPPPSAAITGDWEQVGDHYILNISAAYVKAPVTVTGEYGEYNFTSKTYTGDVDIAVGVNSDDVRISHASIYDPHLVYNNFTTNHTFYYVTNLGATDDPPDIGNDYNTYRYRITHKLLEINNDTNETEWVEQPAIVVAFDSHTTDGTNYTITYQTIASHIEDWRDIPRSRVVVINYEYAGQNKWYLVKDVPFVAGTEYRVRLYWDVKVQLGDCSYKYDLAFKPSTPTIEEAIASGTFFRIDPYYNSSFDRAMWLSIYNNGSALSNFQVGFNFSGENINATSFRLVNWTSQQSEPHWNETVVDGYIEEFWGNFSGIPNGWTNDTYAVVWQSTPTVESASDGDATFIEFDEFTPETPEPWTEVDSPGRITIDRATDERVEIYSISRVEDVYMYQTKTTNSVVMYGKLNVDTLGDSYSLAGVMGVSDTLNDAGAWQNGAGVDIYNNAGQMTVRTTGFSGGSKDYGTLININVDTDYWLKLVIDSTTATFYVYSDASRTTLVGSDTVTIGDVSYSYIYGAYSWNVGGAYSSALYYIDDNWVRKYTANEVNIVAGDRFYYIDTLHYNSTAGYNHSIDSSGIWTSNRSVVAADDINWTAAGDTHLTFNSFNLSETTIANWTQTGTLDWIQAANLTTGTTYKLQYSNGTDIESQVADAGGGANFTTDLAAGTYQIVTVSSDTTSPTYSGVGHNQTHVGSSTLFYIQYDDDTALHTNGQYIFSTNNTGSWVNDSAVNWTATPEWANVTKTLNSTVGTIVGYRWYANDSAGNDNNTPIYTLTVTNTNPVLSDVASSYSLNEGDTLSIDANATDADGDSYTFADNSSEWNINTTTGIVSWVTTDGDQGTYHYYINVTDDHGGTDTQEFSVTVADSTPGSISNLANTTGNFWVNWTWDAGANADDYDVYINEVDEGADTTNLHHNESSSAHSTVNISIRTHNHTLNTYSAWVNDSVTIPNNAITITNTSDWSDNEGQTVYVDYDATDDDSDAPTFSCNRTDLFTDFSTTTGQGNWTTDYTDAGIYYVDFGVSDGYGSTDNYTMTITVTDHGTPGTPTNLQNTTGNFWVNYTWTTGANTDTFNISTNGSWSNGSSNNYTNSSTTAHGWINISVCGYNSTTDQTSSCVSQNTQIPNNAISISDVSSSYSIDEGDTLNIDANYTDVDGDSGTFADNSSEWDVNTSTGIVSWVTSDGDDGVYYWYINVTDGYGSVSTQEFTVTVNDINYIPSDPIDLANTTGNFWVEYTWSAGSGNITDSYNVSINETWTNGTSSPNNVTLGPRGTATIIVYAYNNSGTGTLSNSFITDSVTLPNNEVTITNTSNPNVNEGSNVYVDYDATDDDGDVPIFSTNRTDLFTDFSTSTGQGNWSTNYTSNGTYYVDFGVSDDYGSTDNYTSTITISDFGSPTTPTSLDSTQGIFWINHTWVSGSNTDTFNYSINETWTNGTTNLYHNNTPLDAHIWSNLSIAGYNITSDQLSIFSSSNVQISNNDPVLDTISNQTVNETDTVTIDVNATDVDSDTLTYSTNRTDLFTDFNTTTGQGNWTTDSTDSGTYYVDFGVSDNYSGMDNQTVTITVNDTVSGDITVSSISSFTTETNAYITWTNGSGVSYVLIDTGEEIFNKTTTSLDIRNLQPGHSYTYTFTPYGSDGTAGTSVSYIFSTDSQQDSTGSGTGTGTGTTTNQDIVSDEPSTNVLCYEKSTIEDLSSNIPSTYRTKNTECLSIIKITFTPTFSTSDKPILIEALKSRSRHITEDAPGNLYKYFNLYVGLYGYDEKTTKEKILFRVPITELENTNPKTIKILKYENKKWGVKDTKISSVDNTYYVYESSSTSTYGRFAISSIKEEKPSLIDKTIEKIENNKYIPQEEKLKIVNVLTDLDIKIIDITNELNNKKELIFEEIDNYKIKLDDIKISSFTQIDSYKNNILSSINPTTSCLNSLKTINLKEITFEDIQTNIKNIPSQLLFILIIITTTSIIGGISVYLNYDKGKSSLIIALLIILIAYLAKGNIVLEITDHIIINTLIAIIMYPIIGVTISNIMEKIENAITK